MPLCGGMSDSKPADAEIQKICDQLRPDIESKAGKKFNDFTALHYNSQVVAGTNYFVKVHTGNDDCVHVRIYKPLPHTNQPPSVHSLQMSKSRAEPVEYF